MADVLERARQLGFLGPGPIDTHLAHALRYAAALGVEAASVGPFRVADLGAGGGVPSLPLMTLALPSATATLVDANGRRTAFLVWACTELGIDERVEVWTGRAEVFGHLAERRAAYDAVVARGFGAPAFTIEAAVGLLVTGGRVVISEPPGGRRWPEAALAEVGLTQVEAPVGLAAFVRDGAVPDELPRPVKQQRRRPLFEL